MSLVNLQDTFAQNVALLLIFIKNNGVKCSLGEAWRSAEQAAIYAKEGKGIVDSLHCKRLALDLNLFGPTGELLSASKDYEWAGTYWESLNPNNRWGGRFSRADGNHFEMKEVPQH